MGGAGQPGRHYRVESPQQGKLYKPRRDLSRPHQRRQADSRNHGEAGFLKQARQMSRHWPY